jgi:FtsH-binding integral membrane protein
MNITALSSRNGKDWRGLAPGFLLIIAVMLCYLSFILICTNETGGNMTQNLQQTYDLSGSTQLVRHRVLRNTYWLLALSMIPTVLGAFVGVQMHLPMLGGGMGMLLFMAIAFGFIFAIEKTKNSGLGVAVLLGFTFFMGLMLTPI